MAEDLKVKISADTASFDAGMAHVKKSVLKFSKLAAAAGVAAAAVFTGASIKSAMDFQSQLAQVSTMLDKNTMSYMPKFSKGLEDMSMRFGESTSTLSKGFYDILSASVAPSKAMNVLGVSAKAATAGLSDTGTAADAITTILNSYGMNADKAGGISDKLFSIVKRGKTTFAELAPSIGRVASTASMAGLNFDELGAAISTLTRAGISTDEAMTSISGVLRAFLKPTDDAQKVAHQFGFELSSNTLKSIGLIGVLKKLKGASAEQLATLFPNIRGLKGVAAALGDLKGITYDYNTILNSTGATQEAYNKITDTTAFRVKQLKASFNALKVATGKRIMPSFTPALIGVQGLITGLVELTNDTIDFGSQSANAGLKTITAFENISIAIVKTKGIFARMKVFMEQPIEVKAHVAENWFEKTFGKEGAEKSFEGFKTSAKAIGKAAEKSFEGFKTSLKKIGIVLPPHIVMPGVKIEESDLTKAKKVNDYYNKQKEITKHITDNEEKVREIFKKGKAEYQESIDKLNKEKIKSTSASEKSKKALDEYQKAEKEAAGGAQDLSKGLDEIGASALKSGNEIEKAKNKAESWHTYNIAGVSANRLLTYIGSLHPTTVQRHILEIQLKWNGRKIRIDQNAVYDQKLINEVGKQVIQQILSGRSLAFGGG